MRTFTLHLQSALRYERIERVSSFVGEDRSGQFGILGGHERLVTVLVPGLARFRTGNEPWQYLALPGAVLYFAHGELSVNARLYERSADYRSMRAVLRDRLSAEEEELRTLNRCVRDLEGALFKRLYELQRGTVPA